MSLDHLNSAQGFSPMRSLCLLAFLVGGVHDSLLYEVEAAASNMLIAKTEMTSSHLLQKSKEFYSLTPLFKYVSSINLCKVACCFT